MLSILALLSYASLKIKSANAQSSYTKFQEEVIGEINGTLISKFTEPINGTVCYATSNEILNCR